MAQRVIRDKRYFARVDNWQLKLLDFVDKMQHIPFSYGTHDCALWGADCLWVQTGFDIAAEWRGKYSTLQQGLKLVKASGFTDHIDVFSQQMYEVPASRASFGDLVVVTGIEGMASLGVCTGHIIYAPTQTTMGVTLLTEAVRAFRVVKVEGDDEFDT